MNGHLMRSTVEEELGLSLNSHYTRRNSYDVAML